MNSICNIRGGNGNCCHSDANSTLLYNALANASNLY